MRRGLRSRLNAGRMVPASISRTRCRATFDKTSGIALLPHPTRGAIRAAEDHSKPCGHGGLPCVNYVIASRSRAADCSEALSFSGLPVADVLTLASGDRLVKQPNGIIAREVEATHRLRRGIVVTGDDCIAIEADHVFILWVHRQFSSWFFIVPSRTRCRSEISWRGRDRSWGSQARSFRSSVRSSCHA
jgi:hypothetical protein